METLIDLRTAQTDRLVARLEPHTFRLHVRVRGEMCTFDLPAIAQACGADGLIVVRVAEPGIGISSQGD